MTFARRLRRLLTVISVLVVFTGALLYFGPGVREWYVLRDFTPSAEISQLATDTAMTDRARRMFYLNNPQVLDRSEFNERCQGAGGEQTIVLGCYHSPQRGIFVFRVDEAELHGIEQVTAAHEMLHAAYDRLSSRERRHIDALLTNYYEHDLKDERIRSVMRTYTKTEPHDLANEMHSIFGTEIAELPPELEKHYAQYFTDRSVVVQFAHQYQAAFSRRQDNIAAYDTQLSAMESRIKENEGQLDILAAALRNDRQRVESSGSQAEVNAYNQRVADYNALLQETNTLVQEYNALVETRNAIALEQKQLQQSINSGIH
ncbi:hypothetical protein E6P97_01700 [Patescibacteria group bacterium]|nr:MAG: hypothetical protein E6P97_01700 [Patescibacteria group bacterium]